MDANGSSSAGTTRRADGKPETQADRRFFDLRESGYTGPIDHDGRPVTTGYESGALAALRRAD
jgi:hypothetical protein